ncbi:metallophosphoesterase [Pseudomonas sp. CNPSo 3701]|uniref:metallophosphoesterase n=1 Tax=Pseudomonas sp. CNPSo 3701 TaxID=3027943 RepID=UPI002363DC75|nr:metallophosphoesterase [Pseudomonas sp. CNPSo 3701]MDD1507716.1 metallophosphoesterase [Pseudomonas sp. CNPSo 3701]
MRILIYSDLHLEFGVGFEPPHCDADIAVLAGDIGKGVKAVGWANDAFKCHAVFVAGNHEFYSGHIDRTWEKMQVAAAPHLHLLENQAFVWEGVRFLGTTAWTDFALSGDPLTAAHVAQSEMNDYKRIRAGDSFRKLRPADVIKRNRIAYDWLKGELEKPFDGRTIVVTHHCPLMQLIGGEHQDHLSAAYSNNWPELVSKADVWIFGHTHEAVDDKFYGCRLISNPRGYPDEDTGFSPTFAIDL